MDAILDLNDVSLPVHPAATMFPMMEGPEFDQLVEDIARNGLREPIWVDLIGRVLDGRNRDRACLIAGVPLEFQTYDGDDPLAFVISLNVHRRHLSESQRAMVAARLANISYGEVGRGGQQEGQICTSSAASLLNVSERSVKTARVVREQGAPAVVAAIDAGLVTVADAAKMVDRPTEEQESLVADVKSKKQKTLHRAAVARRHQARETPPPNAQPPADRCCLFVASVANMAEHIESGSIDCIITDPPYPKEFLPVYAELARTAATILKPGGSCLVMVGQSYLPDILAAMTPYLRYHWTVAYLTPGGQSVQLWNRKVNTFWKPVLWFINGGEGYQGDWIGDVTRSAPNDNDKRFHHWGQSETGMADLVRRVTVAGETILDPFLGGGTTGVVALDLGRLFIGADIDAAAVDTARARLSRTWEATDAGQA